MPLKQLGITLPEEREKYIAKKTAWLNDEEKKAAAIKKMLNHPNKEANIKVASKG